MVITVESSASQGSHHVTTSKLAFSSAESGVLLVPEEADGSGLQDPMVNRGKRSGEEMESSGEGAADLLLWRDTVSSIAVIFVAIELWFIWNPNPKPYFFSSCRTTLSSLSSLAHAAPFRSRRRRHTSPLAATIHLAPPHISRSPSLAIASLSIVRDCHSVADFNLGS
ncbi:hypothetical protein ACOSQ4_004173 [Xanthoceras sorbifolium]